ncbi:MAG: response regulator [Candidatus Eisenbacteria sp.]|nr:response regulator [Candidatus Eisenbacteria bacterium]
MQTRQQPEIPVIERAVGGFLPGHAYLVHGAPGVGKTVLGLQAAQAWTAVQRPVLYLTNDPPAYVLQQASLLGLSLETAWRDERLILCAYAPDLPRQIGRWGMAAFLQNLREVGAAHRIGALILDPMIPLFQAYGRPSEARRNVGSLVGFLRESEWSALFLASTEQLRRQSGLRESLRQHCWGVLELRHGRAPGELRSGPYYLKVEKARQVSVDGAVVPYAIALEAGLIPTAAEGGGEQAGELDSTESLPRRPRVLLACREHDFVEPLSELLRHGMDVEVTGEGSDALSRAATWQPDVLVAQQDLPGISGLGLARALRHGHYAMPVILLSVGGRRRSDRVRALIHGATDFVEGPFDVRELAARIQMASRLRVKRLPTGPEENWWETLLGQGRGQGRSLPLAEFLEALTLAQRGAAHFASPVSVAAFRFTAGGDPRRDRVLWDRFRRTLHRGIREGDFPCFPDPDRALVLLCHEHAGGAQALISRMREAARDELLAPEMEGLAWRIDASSVTPTAHIGEPVAPIELLAALEENWEPLLKGAGDETGAGAEEGGRTGTDGG